jgi:hypothetical protein
VNVGNSSSGDGLLIAAKTMPPLFRECNSFLQFNESTIQQY